jgi:hypothetical protein
MRLSKVQDLIIPHGLVVLASYPANNIHRILIGNAGSQFWPRFKQSAEFLDGNSNPLDRWSRKIGLAVAGQTGAKVVFPFEGPPYPPFLDWAKESGQVFSSPVSISIHWQLGLWHAYRFALELEELTDGSAEINLRVSPCDSCKTKPCLSACPVSAFRQETYWVNECMDFLQAKPQSACRTNGCDARRACPVRSDLQYQSEHAQFHMNAFVGRSL